MPLVFGRAAKILDFLYSEVKPNIGRGVTFGQVATSAISAADHAFISSDAFGSAGLRVPGGFNFLCGMASIADVRH